jgi:hypothetical protein
MKYKPGFIGFETERKKTVKNEKECNTNGVTTASFEGSRTVA